MKRKIINSFKAISTREGAGVHLKRVFGYHQIPHFDPFLLLDHFGSKNPADYLAGFPDHPHRGIETVTYMWHGNIVHRDSLGNEGTIKDGDVQWMSAGSGIIHSEMPQKTEGLMQGFQLWVNLPASQKMMPPRYRDVPSNTIPKIILDNGVRSKVICGNFNKTQGPVTDIVTAPLYVDLTIPAKGEFQHPLPEGYTAFCYIVSGSASFAQPENKIIAAETVALLERKGELAIFAKEEGCRLLLIAGQPINEPVAWYGPIVMNTQQELDRAFKEYNEGTFIKDQ